ncbi:MAG: hypothetical protein FJX71_03775 [Alphaproteobacteria bacterium]|nr:hypothetical protein [Alphaproteobacteria bacterium]
MFKLTVFSIAFLWGIGACNVLSAEKALNKEQFALVKKIFHADANLFSVKPPEFPETPFTCLTFIKDKKDDERKKAVSYYIRKALHQITFFNTGTTPSFIPQKMSKAFTLCAQFSAAFNYPCRELFFQVSNKIKEGSVLNKPKLELNYGTSSSTGASPPEFRSSDIFSDEIKSCINELPQDVGTEIDKLEVRLLLLTRSGIEYEYPSSVVSRLQELNRDDLTEPYTALADEINCFVNIDFALVKDLLPSVNAPTDLLVSDASPNRMRKKVKLIKKQRLPNS